MADFDQEDVLRQIAEMRKDLNSLGSRFEEMEQKIESQSRQMENAVQALRQSLSSGGPATKTEETPSLPPTDIKTEQEVTGASPVDASDSAIGEKDSAVPPQQDPKSEVLEKTGEEAKAPFEQPEQAKEAPSPDAAEPKGTEQTRGAYSKAVNDHSGDSPDSSKPSGGARSNEKEARDGQKQENAEPADAGQGLETRIGSVWLNRLGVGIFLIGVVLALLWSSQYWNAFMRDFIGAAIAGVIIWFSHFRRQEAPERKRFFEGINALGWAIAYFVAYGMYFVEPLKINPSLELEMPLLLLTAAGGMADAVAFDSEATALMNSLFAFFALILCVPDVNPVVFNLGFLVIAAALTCVTIRKNWHGALFSCCVLFFGSAQFCNFTTYETRALSGVPVPGFLLNAVLVAGWLLFNSAIWVLKEIPLERRWAVIGISLISAFSLPSLLNHTLELQYHGADPNTIHAWVYGSIGCFYMITARFFKTRKSEDLWTLHYLIGLSLINTSRWLKLAGFTDSGLVSDLCEIVLLTAFGLRFNIPAFRYFAAFWAFIAVMDFWTSNSALMLLGVLSSALCAHLYWKPNYRENQQEFERLVMGPWFYVVANIFCLHMIFGSFPHEWQFSALVLQASINAVLSLHLRWKTAIGVASVVLYCFATSGLFWLLNTSQSVLSTIISYCVYFYSRDLYLKNNGSLEKFWKIVYAIFGNVLIFWSTCAQVPANYMSAAWGFHGLVLVVLGFSLLEKTFRVIGLLLFALVTLRLLFFDFASLPTIGRIMSFIVAGAVFVGCSYIYTWWSKTLAEAEVRANSEMEDTEPAQDDAAQTEAEAE